MFDFYQAGKNESKMITDQGGVILDGDMRTAKEVLGGVFVNYPERKKLRRPSVRFNKDFMLDEEPDLRSFRRPFVTAEDVFASEHTFPSSDRLSADTLTEAFELDAKVVATIGNNPSFLAIAFHMAKEEKLWDLFNVLPTVAQYAVTEFGSEAVISALESEPAQDNVDSLFSLVRAARIELAEQRSGKANRAVACGILQALGFTPEEIGHIKATKKIRPAKLVTI